MKNRSIPLALVVLSLVTPLWAAPETIPQMLIPQKDNFSRTNKQIRNSGANELLYLAPSKMVIAYIAFDLSSVSNKILHAELRIHQASTQEPPLSFSVFPMANTTNNANWGEGKGSLGAGGQNARIGESCYARSAYRDVKWESASGTPLLNLGTSRLWQPAVANLKEVEWKEEWISIPLSNEKLLEEIRGSKIPQITFGFWGSSGKGLYPIHSRESSFPPELHLVLEKQPSPLKK
jgi:hypothetical protein